MPQRLRSALIAGLLTGSVAACHFEPSVPELTHQANAAIVAENQALDGNPAARDQVLGALEMLCGTPANPGYMLVEEWIDDEIDPNYGEIELTEDEYDAMLAGNLSKFADQLAAIAEGDFASVSVPRTAPDLAESWNELLDRLAEVEADIEAGEAEPDAYEALIAEMSAVADPDDEDSEDGEAVALFTYWYPTLRDSAELYRVQCLHCHGVSGGGDGPTANFLDPRPRDYRAGVFKNTALDAKARPRRQDLFRTLERGIYGTSMPSFRRFSDAQLHGLTDYVRLLSIRGETEILLALDYDPDEGGLPFEAVKETYLDVWEKWNVAAENVIAFDGEIPRSTPERVANGREIFHDAGRANCVSCHGEGGRGDGPSAFEPDPETGEPVRVKDDWGNPIVPRRLHLGLFRFGRRPIDIYRRVYAGINGTPMPSHAGMKDPADPSKRLMSDDDLWDIVHYVRSLSSHEMEAVASSESHATDDHAGSGH